MARFQIVPVGDRHRRGAGDFAWRFLAANNRSVARSVPTFTDVDSCLAAIDEFRTRLPCAVATTVRNATGHWVWRIRAAESDIAVSSGRYQRRVRARLACESFVDLVTGALSVGDVQVVRR